MRASKRFDDFCSRLVLDGNCRRSGQKDSGEEFRDLSAGGLDPRPRRLDLDEGVRLFRRY